MIFALMFYLLTMELRRRRALRLRPFLQNKKAPLIKDLAEVHNTLVSGKSSNINKQQAQALAEAKNNTTDFLKVANYSTSF